MGDSPDQLLAQRAILEAICAGSPPAESQEARIAGIIQQRYQEDEKSAMNLLQAEWFEILNLAWKGVVPLDLRRRFLASLGITSPADLVSWHFLNGCWSLSDLVAAGPDRISYPAHLAGRVATILQCTLDQAGELTKPNSWMMTSMIPWPRAMVDIDVAGTPLASGLPAYLLRYRPLRVWMEPREDVLVDRLASDRIPQVRIEDEIAVVAAWRVDPLLACAAAFREPQSLSGLITATICARLRHPSSIGSPRAPLARPWDGLFPDTNARVLALGDGFGITPAVFAEGMLMVGHQITREQLADDTGIATLLRTGGLSPGRERNSGTPVFKIASQCSSSLALCVAFDELLHIPWMPERN